MPITDIKRDKLHKLSDNAKNIIIFSDRLGQIIEVNAAAINAYGYTREELLGKKTFELRAAHSKMLALNQLALADKSGLIFEAKHMRKDGNTFEAEISSFSIDIEEDHYIMHIVQDVSERKRAEARILKDEMRSRALFEMSQSSHMETENLAALAMSTALNLSESKAGFFAFVTDEVSSIHVLLWGKDPTLPVSMPPAGKFYPLSSEFVWHDMLSKQKPMLGNNIPDNIPKKKVLPEDIIIVERFLAIPIFDTGRLNALAIVVNKEKDYQKEDIRNLAILFNSMWSIAYRTKTDKKIHDLLDDLEKRNQIEKSLATIARRMLTSEVDSDNFAYTLEIITNLFDAKVVIIPIIHSDGNGPRLAWHYRGCSRNSCLLEMNEDDIRTIAGGLHSGVSDDGRFGSFMSEHGLNSLITVPIFSVDEPVGMIIAGFAEPNMSASWTEEALKTIAELCGMYLNREFLIKKIEGKNKEISEALETLKQTQMHLIHREKLAGIGQLAAGVAHEINNPLGFVSSNMDVLTRYMEKISGFFTLRNRLISDAAKETANPGAEESNEILEDYIRKQKINIILNDLESLIEESRDGIDRIARIVSGLKLFARQDINENHESYNLNTGIATTLTVARNEIKYYADVEESLQENLPEVDANGSEINQVLLNMIVNAVYAIREKSETERGRIFIKTWSDTENVYCSIEDTGIGIPEDKLSFIFNPFYTTKPIGKGTGLGLSISYEIIVRKHRGQILVDSTPGRGARFTLSIPQKRENVIVE